MMNAWAGKSLFCPFVAVLPSPFQNGKDLLIENKAIVAILGVPTHLCHRFNGVPTIYVIDLVSLRAQSGW